MSAPKPANFRALANAWDSPIAYATELARYYSQLEAEGYRVPTPDITRERREPQPDARASIHTRATSPTASERSINA